MLLCYWPADHVRLVDDDGSHFARGRYTSEFFETAEGMERATQQLLATLAANCAITVRPVGAAAVCGEA